MFSVFRSVAALMLILFAGIMSASGHAQTIIDANDRGWYRSDGALNPGNNNTFTGRFNGVSYRSYYRFSIPAAVTCLSSVTLELELEAHFSGSALHDLALYDVDITNVPLLDTSDGSGSGAAIFTDLGSGALYGEQNNVASADVGSILSFNLPASALTEIVAAAGGDFAIGAALTSSGGGTQGLRFSAGDEPRVHRLTLTGCPDITATKSQSVFDPAAEGLYALPGNDIIYTISVLNQGEGVVDNNSMALIDALPPEIEFLNADIDTGGPDTYPGTAPVAFTDAGSGLTFNYATDVAFSNAAARPASFADCTYSPLTGYDPAVTYICINPKGVMAAGGLPDPGFSISFRARIK